MLDESLISESFVRSSGPGGQNVNKVATAVELRFNLGASRLSDDTKARFRVLAGQRLTTGDVVIIQAHEYRSQTKNREAARARLIEWLDRAANPPRKRRKTKPSRASKEVRIAEKKRRGEKKRFRRADRSED